MTENRRTPGAHALAAALLFFSLHAGALGQDAGAFKTALDAAEKQMERQKWRPAYDAIQELLRTHAGQPYVLAERVRIEENLKRCAFRIAVEVPDIKQLISGELLSYDRKTGEIKLRYTPDTAGDFKVSRDGLLVHPLLFDGSYVVEVKGSRYPEIRPGTDLRPPTIWVGFEKDEFVLACFGFERLLQGRTVYHHTAYLVRKRGEDVKVLAEKDTTPCKSGEPYQLKVTVAPTQVSMFVSGRKLLSGPKAKGVYGTAAFEGLSGWDEILLSGDAETSWVQQLEDRALQEKLLAFDKTYEKSAHLPDWFLKGEVAVAERAPVAAIAAALRDYPGPQSDVHDDLYRLAVNYLERGGHQGGIRFVHEKSGRMSAELKSWLLARFAAAEGEKDQAMVYVGEVLAADPDFVPAALLKLELAGHGDDPDAAEREIRAAVGAYPASPEAHLLLVRLLFDQGRLEEARAAVGEALAKGARSDDLDDYERYLGLALKGPDWSRVFEHQSKNYHVLSDIDVETCREAARLLELCYAAYSSRLKPVPGLERRKFRVYLFAGQDGYEMHIQRVLGGVDAYHTLGVYSGNLKQLFIWNQRDREEMMATVRHEGFHQYFDRIAEEKPVWLNEGLAEYYEAGDLSGGRLEEGRINKDHVAALKGTAERPVQLIATADFIRQDHEAFYKKAALTYPQAWAFVHFLRHAPREKGKNFQKLFDLLANGADAEAAVEKAFAGVDLAELHARFLDYVAGL